MDLSGVCTLSYRHSTAYYQIVTDANTVRMNLAVTVSCFQKEIW